MSHLAPQQQQALQLHWLNGLGLKKAADAAGTTFARFRTRVDLALKCLCNEFFRIRYKTETLDDQMKLLSKWGDVRPDLHWVPDDRYEKCRCPECEKIRRESASYRIIVPATELVIAPTLNVVVQLTDRDGYKLPGKTKEVTFFGFGGGPCQEMRIVA